LRLSAGLLLLIFLFPFHVSALEKEDLLVLPKSGLFGRLVVILPGYTPPGDPYQQRPSHFASKWPLQQWADSKKTAFLVVNVGATLYPREVVRSLERRILRICGGKKLMLIGVSTGVEGLCKLMAHSSLDIKLAVGISGTYDLFSLPPGSGEYGIHAKEWGERSEAWKAHDPSCLLSVPIRSRKIPMHLFSEEKSIYRDQMDLFLQKKPAGVRLFPHPQCGMGLGHNWDFWASSCLIRQLSVLVDEGG
jgi:hypothetical protein